MPGPLVHVGAIVQCIHGGMAQPIAPNPRVLVSGQPTATLAAPYAIAGCTFPTASGGPCATAQWVVGSVRVLSNGQPLVLQGGVAVCVPTGTPLIVTTVQPRVIAT